MAAIVAIIGGLVAGGTAYYNSEQGKKAAEKAAAAEQEAARNASANSAAAQGQARSDSAPYANVGQRALYTLADLMGQRVNEAAPSYFGDAPVKPTDEAYQQAVANMEYYNKEIPGWAKDLGITGDKLNNILQNSTDYGALGAGGGFIGMEAGKTYGLLKSLQDNGEPRGNSDMLSKLLTDRAKQQSVIGAYTNFGQTQATYEQNKKAYEDWQARQSAPNSAQFGSLTKQFSTEDFYNNQDPAYAIRMAENIKGLDRSAAARGNLFSGAQAKALGRFTQDYASNEYANAYNRYTQNQADIYNKYANLAGIGQTAVQQVNSLGANSAANQGYYLMQGGNAAGQGYLNAQQARASGYTGMANSLNAGLTNYLTYQQTNSKAKGVA